MNRRGFVKSVLGAATIVAIPSTIAKGLASTPFSFPAYGIGRTWWSPTHSTPYNFNFADPLRMSPLEFAQTIWKDKKLYPWQERVLEAMADAHANGKKLTVTWPPRRPRCVCPKP